MKKLLLLFIFGLISLSSFAQIRFYDRTSYVEIRNMGKYVNITKGAGYSVKRNPLYGDNHVQILKSDGIVVFDFLVTDCDTPSHVSVNSLISQITALLGQTSGGGGSGGDATAANQVITNTLITDIDDDLATIAKDTTFRNGYAKIKVTNFPATQPISGSLSVSNFPSTYATTGTYWQATQPVSGTFWQSTQPVSVSSLPLPTGSATSANQATANTALATIAANSGTYSFRNITIDDTAGVLIHSGAGSLHTVVVNMKGVGTILQVYNGLTKFGTLLGTIDTTLSTTSFTYDATMGTGLFVRAIGTGISPVAADITITYK